MSNLTPDAGNTTIPADPAAVVTPPVTEPAKAEPVKEPVKAAEPAKAEPAQPTVPDKYEFKAPEGIELDTASLEALTPTFKELGLTQDGAQKLVETYATRMQSMHAERTAQWEKDAKADTTFGGKDFEANVQLAQKGIARVGTPAFKALLDQTGLGNHVEVLRVFQTIGKAISEDSVPNLGQPQADRSAKAIYNHPTSQVLT